MKNHLGLQLLSIVLKIGGVLAFPFLCIFPLAITIYLLSASGGNVANPATFFPVVISLFSLALGGMIFVFVLTLGRFIDFMIDMDDKINRIGGMLQRIQAEGTRRSSRRADDDA